MNDVTVMFGTCRERLAYWEHVDSVRAAQRYLDMRGVSVGHFYNSPTYIREGRQSIVEGFLETDSDFLCFIDSDNVLHEETIWRLLKHDMPIVGALYFKRRGPPEAVAFAWGDTEMTKCHSESQRIRDWMVERDLTVFNHPACLDVLGNTVEEFDVVGFGCTLIRRDVIEQLVSKYKDIFGGHDADVGEDVYFCRLAHQEGIMPAIDLSLHIGHIQSKIVTAADFVSVGEWNYTPKDEEGNGGN